MISILLSVTGRQHIDCQRDRRREQKDDDADRRADGIIVFGDRQVIQPVDEQVGIAREEIPVCNETAAAQEIEDAEIVEIRNELRDKDRGRCKYHERKGDRRELLERACSVDLCRFIEIAVHVAQDACCQQHTARDIQPAVDDETDPARRPLGVEIQKADRLSARLDDHLVDGPAVGEHKLKAEQRDKPRHRVGEDGEHPPERLPADAFLVVKQCDPEPAEIVERRRQDRPYDVPEQDLEKRGSELPQRQDLDKTFKPFPVDEHGRFDVRAIVGEGNEDHEHDGQHVEDAHADDRDKERRLVKLIVEHTAHLVLERPRLFALLHGTLHGVCVFDVGIVKIEIDRKHDKGKDPHQHHDDGIVSFDPVPRIGLYGPQRKESRDRFRPDEHKETNGSDLNEKIQDPLCPLPIQELPEPHDAGRADHLSVCTLHDLFDRFEMLLSDFWMRHIFSLRHFSVWIASYTC